MQTRLFAAWGLLVVLAPQLPAQDAPRREFGVLVGMGSSTLSDTTGSAYGLEPRRSSFVAGALVRLPMRPGLGVQLEVLWNAKQVRSRGTGTSDTVVTSERMNYVSVPVLLRVAPASAHLLVPRALIGPFVAVKSHCRNDGSCTGYGSDVGIMAGGAVDWRRATLSVRYEAGSQPLREGSAVRNRGWLALVAWLW